MTDETLVQSYLDRCEEVRKTKNIMQDLHDLEADNSEPIDRRFLWYAIDVTCMKRRMLESYLSGLSHPELSLLLAVYKCIDGNHDFPEDVSSLRQTNTKKEILIRSIREKKPEKMISHLNNAQNKIAESDEL